MPSVTLHHSFAIVSIPPTLMRGRCKCPSRRLHERILIDCEHVNHRPAYCPITVIRLFYSRPASTHSLGVDSGYSLCEANKGCEPVSDASFESIDSYFLCSHSPSLSLIVPIVPLSSLGPDPLSLLLLLTLFISYSYRQRQSYILF